MKTAWEKVIKEAGLDICFHTLRHTAAPHSCIARIKMRKDAKWVEKNEIKVQNASVNASVNASLSPLQQQILGVLSRDPKASYEALVSKLGKDRTTINERCRNLTPIRIKKNWSLGDFIEVSYEIPKLMGSSERFGLQ